MTLLHQAAQKAVEALTAVQYDKSFCCLKEERTQAVVLAAIAQLSAALQQQPEPVASNYRGKCADDNHCSFSCLMSEPCLRSNYAARVLAERTAPPALQHQEVPREPVADFDTWQQNPYTKVLMDSIKNDYMPRADADALIRAAASPSTTRQQEVRPVFDELIAFEETCEVKPTFADAVSIALAAKKRTRQQEVVRLSDFVNAARINASDMPYTVLQKLQAAIDAAPSTTESGVSGADGGQQG